MHLLLPLYAMHTFLEQRNSGLRMLEPIKLLLVTAVQESFLYDCW